MLPNNGKLTGRESDRIGAKVAKPVMKETKLLTKT
eukprot:gene16937-19302_t